MIMRKLFAAAALSLALLVPAKAEVVQKTSDLILTPATVSDSGYGPRVLFQIENKSNRNYRTVMWDCAAFWNSKPVSTRILISHNIPANGRVFEKDSFDIDGYVAPKPFDPTAFSFECRMMSAAW
jgi:hypothetical protein